MSKYIEPVIESFLLGKNKKINNTESRENVLYLFGNKIAWTDIHSNVWIQDCGYKTRTTQNRINMLPQVQLRRKKGQWILTHPNSIPEILWDGKAINIGKI